LQAAGGAYNLTFRFVLLSVARAGAPFCKYRLFLKEQSDMDGLQDVTTAAEFEIGEASRQASSPFVGKWNRLVSTTNWEKGRIIGEWRASLAEAGASAREYSDEAWSRLVGCVTAQHCGRLRRVYQRFGDSRDQYDGLYWSHFQAAVDWDDAEMYLEGAVREKWSVAMMRRTRWEAMGELAADEPRDGDIVNSELDEDFEPAQEDAPESETIRGEYGEVQGPRFDEGPDFGDEDGQESDSSTDQSANRDTAETPTADDVAAEPVRPFADLAELPQDVTDAFDSFKLSIIRHKSDNWSEISRDEMLAVLDSLKELTLAPAQTEDSAPF
jgi:hypothetical protein